MKFNIPIKALSVNEAWQGKRYKTIAYKKYENDVYKLLTGIPKAPEGGLEVTYWFYMTNHKLADNDNPVKPLQDILKKRGIIKDDRFIYATHIFKIPSTVDRIEVNIQPFMIPAMV
jgi:Holliday junction resolvase RusA-like endonuclease